MFLTVALTVLQKCCPLSANVVDFTAFRPSLAEFRAFGCSCTGGCGSVPILKSRGGGAIATAFYGAVESAKLLAVILF